MTTISPPPFDPPPVVGGGPMGAIDEHEGTGIEEVLMSGPPGPLYGAPDDQTAETVEPESMEAEPVGGPESTTDAPPRRPRRAVARKRKATRKRARRRGDGEQGRSRSPESPVLAAPPSSPPAVPRDAGPDADSGAGPGDRAGFEWKPWMTYSGGGLLGLIILILLLILLGGGGDDAGTRTATTDGAGATDDAGGPERSSADETAADDDDSDGQPAEPDQADQADDVAAAEGDDDRTGVAADAADDQPTDEATDDGGADPPAVPGSADPAVADRVGDTFDCATGAPLDRPDIDIRSLSARVDGDRIRSHLIPGGDPSRLFVTSWSGSWSIDHVAMVTRTRFDERHDGTDRAGEIDPATGEVISGTEQTITVSDAHVLVDAPFDPSDPPVLAVGRSFQTPSEGDAKGCDVAMAPVTPYPYGGMVGPGTCTPDGVACVNDGRFSVVGTEAGAPLGWTPAPDGVGVVATAADGGSIQVNLIPACGINGTVWTFLMITGGTDLTVAVTDTVTGEAFTHSTESPDGNPVVDTELFDSCP